MSHYETCSICGGRFEPFDVCAECAEEMSDLAALQLTRTRYEKVRKLSPHGFKDLFERNLKGEGRFEELVDRLEDK